MPDLTKLEKTLGLAFKDKDNLLQALVHRSYLNEDQKFKFSNERLEFLGDSVLSLVTSQYLYDHYPTYPEGQLTCTRSLLVQAKTLGKIASELDLGQFLMMSKGEELSGGRMNMSLLANTMEAVMGAIFIDQGFDSAKKFITRILLARLSEFISQEEIFDYKSLLQEKVQEMSKLSPSYAVTNSEGPDHAKVFFVQAMGTNSILGTGRGKSKQIAEQMAAKDALEKLR